MTVRELAFQSLAEKAASGDIKSLDFLLALEKEDHRARVWPLTFLIASEGTSTGNRTSAHSLTSAFRQTILQRSFAAAFVVVTSARLRAAS